MPSYEQVIQEVDNRRPFNLVVDDYMAMQTPEHQARVDDACDQLLGQSTPSFLAARDTQVGFPIPIAATESGYIGHTLEQYARQRDPGRRRLLGYLNWDDETPQHTIDRTRDVLDAFIEGHPEVPFAYFEGPIGGPLAIGGLRKVVSEALMVYSADDRISDMLLLGGDADAEWIHPDFTRIVGKRFLTNRRYPVTGIIPYSHYARTPNLPNMDMVVQFSDDWDVMWPIRNYYEPGPGVSARAMMAVGGYDPACRLGETHILLNTIHDGNARFIDRGCLWVREAEIAMSARRPYEKMYMGNQPFWSEAEPMTAGDSYRELGKSHFEHWPDISRASRDARLHITIEDWLQEYVRVAPPQNDIKKTFEEGVILLDAAAKRLGAPKDIVGKVAKNMVFIVTRTR